MHIKICLVKLTSKVKRTGLTNNLLDFQVLWFSNKQNNREFEQPRQGEQKHLKFAYLKQKR